MGTGFHGGFGRTRGFKLAVSYKLGSNEHLSKNYTKSKLIDYLDGVTNDSSEIANEIRHGRIKVNILGDKLFENYLGVNSDVVAMAIENKIYLRSSSISLYSDLVHEGKHAIDYLKGISIAEISSVKGEIRAYSSERLFQKKTGIPLTFDSEEDMLVFIGKYYGRKGK